MFLPACEHFAGSERFLEKAFSIQDAGTYTFDVTADLEDGAAIGNEQAHAKRMAEILSDRASDLLRRSGAPKRAALGLRIHDAESSQWEKDLQVAMPIAAKALSYITVPKLRRLEDLHRVARAVDWHCRQAGRDTPMPLHVLIETPSALHLVGEIAEHPSVEVLDFGLLDFISEHAGIIPADAMRSPLQFEHHLLVAAKVALVQAACRSGKVASHNICVDVRSMEVVFADARRAYTSFGFQRMWSIHPDQIAPIVRAFAPDFESLALAQAVLLQGHEASWGPIRHQDTLHDRASYRLLWTLVQQARAQELPLEPEVIAAFFPN